MFSPAWASKLISKPGKVLDFLSAHPEKNIINSAQEQTNRDKCRQMFNTNIDFRNWQKAIEGEKKTKQALFLAEELRQEAQNEYLIAKKICKMKEKACETASPQTRDQAFNDFQAALTNEKSALEEKDQAKQDFKKTKKAFKKAKLKRENMEKLFKESIPRTSVQDFEDSALKRFGSR